MRAMMDFRHRRNDYFHPHPWQGAFALIASLALAVLIVLVLGVSTVR
jgi:hypothetical protein